MNNLLDPPDKDEAEALLEKLILEQAGQSGQQPGQTGQTFTKVLPKPGVCLKTKNKDGEKVFLNICQAENVPEPADITEDELLKILDSDDPSGYRVPMSLGEPHAEIDKSGKGCTSYDIVVNPKFFKKMEESELFRTFFITVSMEGIEEKYSQLLSRDWVILKNRKVVGDLKEQNIRSKSKPIIMEMDSQQNQEKPLIQEVSSNRMQEDEIKSRAPEPPFTIMQEPEEGHPEFLVAEIQLSQVKTATSLTLDIGEDRILLNTRSNAYHLDVFLPFNVIQEDCGAQFNRQSKILTITMPVAAET